MASGRRCKEIIARLAQWIERKSSSGSATLRASNGRNPIQIQPAFPGRSADSKHGGPLFLFTLSSSGALHYAKRTTPQQRMKIVTRAKQVCQHRFELLGIRDWVTEADRLALRSVHGKRAHGTVLTKSAIVDFEKWATAKLLESIATSHFVLWQAYRLTGDETFVREMLRQWQTGTAENPYPRRRHKLDQRLEVAFRTFPGFAIGEAFADKCLVSRQPVCFCQSYKMLVAIEIQVILLSPTSSKSR